MKVVCVQILVGVNIYIYMYPLVNKQFAIESGQFIVDLRINSMVIFHSYVTVLEGIYIIYIWLLVKTLVPSEPQNSW